MHIFVYLHGNSEARSNTNCFMSSGLGSMLQLLFLKGVRLRESKCLKINYNDSLKVTTGDCSRPLFPFAIKR